MAVRKLSLSLLTATMLGACQGAYNTSTAPAQPVLDQFKAKEDVMRIEPVVSGGILMRRTNQEAWEAPKREVDRVRDELSQLKTDLGKLYTKQEQVLAQKFDSVERRVAEMRQREMQEAAQDAELLSLVKEKFDAIDENIGYLKSSDSTTRQQQETLLDVLDQKFTLVESRMEEIDFTSKDVLANQRQEIQSILENLEMETLRRTSSLEQDIASMQAEKERLLSALDQKFTQVQEDNLYLADKVSEDQQKLLSALDYKFNEVQEQKATLEEKVLQEKQDVLDQLNEKLAVMVKEKAELEAKLQKDNKEALDQLNLQIAKLGEEKTQLEKQVQQEKAYLEGKVASAMKKLEIQAQMEEKRRQELQASYAEQTERMKTDLEIENEKRRAILEQKVKQLKDRLRVLEDNDLELMAESANRQQGKQNEIDAKVLAVEERYGRRLSKLNEEQEELEQKLEKLNVKEVLATQKQKEDVVEELAEIATSEEEVQKEVALETEKVTAIRSAIADLRAQKSELDTQINFGNMNAQERKDLVAESEDLLNRIGEEQKALQPLVAQERKAQQKLDALKARHKPTVEKLVATKASLEKNLEDMGLNKVLALLDEQEDVKKDIEQTLVEKGEALADAKDYKNAFEQRIAELESGRKPKTEIVRRTASLPTTSDADIVSEIITSNDVAITSPQNPGLVAGYSAKDWVPLSDYNVVVHDDDKRLRDIVEDAVKRAEPFVGPWEVKWKLRPENGDVLSEKFSLDVETDFASFASYLSSYMKGYRGFNLTFNMFNEERVLVITDDRF